MGDGPPGLKGDLLGASEARLRAKGGKAGGQEEAGLGEGPREAELCRIEGQQ